MTDETHIVITDEIELFLLDEGDTESLYGLIDQNRAHLRVWLPWVDAQKSPADSLGFIKATQKQFTNGLGPNYKIMFREDLVGIISYHPFRKMDRIAEIGYWMAADAQGHGIMTACCEELVHRAFELYEMNRVEIPAAEGNYKSRAIPERLGFTFEGILRERQLLYDRYVNHAMYSLLKREYRHNHKK